MTLKYPNDRHNGYVLLTDGNGNLYVPDMDDSPLKYAGAFLVLASRINRREK